MDFLIIFLEGVISFISPCMLPMLPIYISYFAGDADKKQKVLARSLAFVLGFTVVFGTLGLLAGGAGSNRGTGGMATKLEAAKYAMSHGLETIIMSGDNPKKIFDVFDGYAVGTHIKVK